MQKSTIVIIKPSSLNGNVLYGGRGVPNELEDKDVIHDCLCSESPPDRVAIFALLPQFHCQLLPVLDTSYMPLST